MQFKPLYMTQSSPLALDSRCTACPHWWPASQPESWCHRGCSDIPHTLKTCHSKCRPQILSVWWNGIPSQAALQVLGHDWCLSRKDILVITGLHYQKNISCIFICYLQYFSLSIVLLLSGMQFRCVRVCVWSGWKAWKLKQALVKGIHLIHLASMWVGEWDCIADMTVEHFEMVCWY